MPGQYILPSNAHLAFPPVETTLCANFTEFECNASLMNQCPCTCERIACDVSCATMTVALCVAAGADAQACECKCNELLSVPCGDEAECYDAISVTAQVQTALSVSIDSIVFISCTEERPVSNGTHCFAEPGSEYAGSTPSVCVVPPCRSYHANEIVPSMVSDCRADYEGYWNNGRIKVKSSTLMSVAGYDAECQGRALQLHNIPDVCHPDTQGTVGLTTKLCSEFTPADCEAVADDTCRCKCTSTTEISVLAVAQERNIHFIPPDTVLGTNWHRVKAPAKQYPLASQSTATAAKDGVHWLWAVVAAMAFMVVIMALVVFRERAVARKLKPPAKDGARVRASGQINP